MNSAKTSKTSKTSKPSKPSTPSTVGDFMEAAFILKRLGEERKEERKEEEKKGNYLNNFFSNPMVYDFLVEKVKDSQRTVPEDGSNPYYNVVQAGLQKLKTFGYDKNHLYDIFVGMGEEEINGGVYLVPFISVDGQRTSFFNGKISGDKVYSCFLCVNPVLNFKFTISIQKDSKNRASAMILKFDTFEHNHDKETVAMLKSQGIDTKPFPGFSECAVMVNLKKKVEKIEESKGETSDVVENK